MKIKSLIAGYAASIFALADGVEAAPAPASHTPHHDDIWATAGLPDSITAINSFQDVAKLVERQISGDGFDYNGELVAIANSYGMYFDTTHPRAKSETPSPG